MVAAAIHPMSCRGRGLSRAAAPASSNELVEATVPLPVTIGGNTLRLETFLVKKSDAQGRLPIAILTNGGVTTATAGTEKPGLGYAAVARDLARRGWLAAVVLRRGFGRSEGAKPAPVDCSPSALKDWASAAADDLLAAMETLAKRPDADPSKVMVICAVNAGLAAVALSARNPPGLVAAISIAGGLQAESGCKMNDILVDAYKDYGATSKVPNLWMYSAKDTVFDPALTDRMHGAFLDGGSDVKFVMFRHTVNVGTSVFTEARRQWMVQMDAFLRALHLPTWTEADVKDVIKKLNVTDKPTQEKVMSDLTELYFPSPGEKALAYPTARLTGGAPPPARSDPPDPTSPGGGPTLDAARATALGACQKRGEPCTIVMENNRWVGPTQ